MWIFWKFSRNQWASMSRCRFRKAPPPLISLYLIFFSVMPINMWVVLKIICHQQKLENHVEIRGNDYQLWLTELQQLTPDTFFIQTMWEFTKGALKKTNLKVFPSLTDTFWMSNQPVSLGQSLFFFYQRRAHAAAARSMKHKSPPPPRMGLLPLVQTNIIPCMQDWGTQLWRSVQWLVVGRNVAWFMFGGFDVPDT